MWRHGYTYSAHAAAAAAAMANLDILEEERLISAVDRLQYDLAAALAPLADFDIVREVRAGVGLLAAVDLTPEALADGMPPRILAALRKRGVLTRALASGAVQVSPSFVIDDADLRLLAQALAGALADVGATRAVARPVEIDLLPDITSDEGIDAFDDSHYLEQVPPHH